MLQRSLFDTDDLPVEVAALAPPSADEWWDVNGTIPEYVYLTHNFFRYYGKFPSVIARNVLREFVATGRKISVIDTYAGCGTTLVEASLAGHNSVGLDINPLAVLASNVKTARLPVSPLQDAYRQIIEAANDALASRDLENDLSALPVAVMAKWFLPRACLELAALRRAIYRLNASQVKDYYLLAFAAIIRRVSTAYDGEVRPHFNPDKAARSPLEAFARKVTDMHKRLQDFAALAPPDTCSACFLCDNRLLSSYAAFAPETFDLALTHPPYLNCFDYIPVYRLEFLWLRDLFQHWSLQKYDLLRMPHLDPRRFRKLETRAWPATDAKLVESYRAGNRRMLQALFSTLRCGGICCVVIGDSTVKGELLPVHRWFIEMAEEVGFRHSRTIYRTTHYGTGKYAYEDRSHYHGDAPKRDAIVIVRKP